MSKKPAPPTNLRVALSLAELYEISDAFDSVLVSLDVELGREEASSLRCYVQAEAVQAKVKAQIAAALGK